MKRVTGTIMLVLLASTARAAVDGQITAGDGYRAALAVQDTPTGSGNDFSELAQAGPSDLGRSLMAVSIPS
jgi:hypothetical protein